MPELPVIRDHEKYASGLSFPLVEYASRAVGWQWRSDAKGGPVFVTISRGPTGGFKVLGSFPLSAGGWRSAWLALVQSDPAAAEKAAADARRACG